MCSLDSLDTHFTLLTQVLQSIKKKKRKKVQMEVSAEETASIEAKEKARAARQQKSVFFLCAVVMGRPYDVPKYVPRCLAELSKHSFEHRWVA